MHTQRDTSELIIGKGGDCVLALKGNQRSLHKDAKNWLEDPGNAEKMASHQKVERGHGREETRTATVSRDIGPLQDARRRPGLAATGKAESVRVSERRTRTETRTCIMSRKMSPEDFWEAVWNQWAIKKKLHWVLEVRMREDELRNRRGRGPETMAGIRRLAREHRAPLGRQSVRSKATFAGGAGAGLSTRAHRQSGEAFRGNLKCDCLGLLALPDRGRWRCSNRCPTIFASKTCLRRGRDRNHRSGTGWRRFPAARETSTRLCSRISISGPPSVPTAMFREQPKGVRFQSMMRGQFCVPLVPFFRRAECSAADQFGIELRLRQATACGPPNGI